MPRSTRAAVTALEVLVAVAVLAMLVGLLIPAVQKVRMAAFRTKSANKMRQLVGAAHALSDRHGMMPMLHECVPGGNRTTRTQGGVTVTTGMPDPRYFSWNESPLYSLVHELIGDAVQKYSDDAVYFAYADAPHQSPADPNYDLNHEPGHAVWVTHHPDGRIERGEVRGNCSYLVNATAAKYPAPLHAAFADGTSNTVYLAESYCKSASNEYDLADMDRHGPYPTPARPGQAAHDYYGHFRRATFADAASGDVYPVTSGSPAVATGKFIPQSPQVTGETMFQCAVPLLKSTGKVPYSPYPGGLLVGMADGSVRMIRAGTAESVFWGSVTPAGGEVANLD